MIEQKLKQFIEKYQGKKVEAYDSTNLYQCYDLITQWCYELGLKPPLTLYAYQIFDQNYQQFDKIENTKDAHPEAGDIVVWSKAYNGTAGHTAIATGKHKTEGKASDWFEAFTQNDPVGSPCILKNYSYRYVVGWLRPKKEYIKIDNYYKGIDLNNLESVKVCVDTWYQVAVENLFVKKEEAELLKKQLTEKDEVISKLTQDLLNIKEELNKATEQAKTYKEELDKTEALREKWHGLYNQVKDSLEACQKDRATFQKQLTELKNKQELTLGELLIKIFNKIRGVKI